MEKRKSDRRHVNARILLSCVLLLLAFAGVNGSEPAEPTAKDSQATAAAPANEITVALKDIPVWEVANERVRSSLLRGQYAHVQKDKFPAGKYPAFTSDAPLYGQASFRGAVVGSRRHEGFQFALDCSQKGDDYDLLYFDDNGDGDLTNDKPRKSTPESGRLGLGNPSLKETYFEPVRVTFGPGGAQEVEVLPCLRMWDSGVPQFYFIAARVHTGSFEIDGKSYETIIGYQYSIQGSLDQPSTMLTIAPQGEESAYWWGGDELNATHRLGSHYYRFACTPVGDKLSVRTYDGPLGTFEAGAGGRKVEKLQMQGSLRAKDSALAVGDGLVNGSPTMTRQCRIPVGDYYPAMLHVEMGDLQIAVSNNYHTNAQGQRSLSAPVHGIAIRADKPYVLDFSRKPMVIFEEPKATHRLLRGTDIQVKAVLIDPVLDIMIRGLTVAGLTTTETIKTTDGQERTISRPLSLDPKVTITRANGEMVAEGVMPFG